MSEENKRKSEEALARIHAKKDIVKVLIDSLNRQYEGRLGLNDISSEASYKALEKLTKENTDENTLIVPSEDIHDYEPQSFKPFQRKVINSSLVTVNQFMDSMIIDEAREHNIKKLMAQGKQSIESIDKGSIVPEWYEEADVKRYIEILSGDNPNIFVSMIALQGKDEMTNEPKEKFAVLMYNKKEDIVGVVSNFDVNESERRKLRDKGIAFSNLNNDEDRVDFMRFVKGVNRDIKDDDIYNSVYMISRPDFVRIDNYKNPDEVGVFWGFLSCALDDAERYPADIENTKLVCCIEKPRDVSVNSKVLSNMQKQPGD